MHGHKEISNLPRTTLTVTHLLILSFSGWLLLGGGFEWIGRSLGLEWRAGNESRRLLLMVFGVVLWLRMAATVFVFLKRKFDWNECVSVIAAVAIYQIGFGMLGASSRPVLSGQDYLAGAMFLLGSYLNTGSELQRKKFKDNPKNKGKLHTQGLFRLVRHPNYLGDSLWVSGWAMMTRNWWAGLIALACISGFVLGFIPQLSAYLASRYGEQYEAWTKKTKKLVPYIY